MRSENGMEITPAVLGLAKELNVANRSGHILFHYVLELMQLAYRQGQIDELNKLTADTGETAIQ